MADRDEKDLEKVAQRVEAAHGYLHIDERAAELARLRAWPPGALEEALARGDAYSIPQLAITGADLAAAGIPAGPGVGRLLRALLDGVVEGEIENERAALLCAAQRWNLQEEESCR